MREFLKCWALVIGFLLAVIGVIAAVWGLLTLVNYLFGGWGVGVLFFLGATGVFASFACTDDGRGW